MPGGIRGQVGTETLPILHFTHFSRDCIFLKRVRFVCLRSDRKRVSFLALCHGRLPQDTEGLLRSILLRTDSPRRGRGFVTFFIFLFAPYLVWSYDTFYILFRCCVVCTAPFGGSLRCFGGTRQSRFGILFFYIHLSLPLVLDSFVGSIPKIRFFRRKGVCFISARGCDRSSQKYVHTYTHVHMSSVYAFVVFKLDFRIQT